MRTFVDITCTRCGCTESSWWIEASDLLAAHVCPDGKRPDVADLSLATRVVPGPGERGKDEIR